MSGEVALLARVSGRVQGVSFRAWTRDEARARGLHGWVKNNPDGTVSALIAGLPEAVEEMRRALQNGPRFSRVDRVDTTTTDPTEAPTDFRILF